MIERHFAIPTKFNYLFISAFSSPSATRLRKCGSTHIARSVDRDSVCSDWDTSVCLHHGLPGLKDVRPHGVVASEGCSVPMSAPTKAEGRGARCLLHDRPSHLHPPPHDCLCAYGAMELCGRALFFLYNAQHDWFRGLCST